MKASFDNDLVTSFCLWLDNRLIKDGEGFQNKAVTLYKQTDSSRSSLVSYNSPFKAWVADSCQENAIIPSGFYGTGGFYNRNSGIILDFLNGRVLSSGDLGATLTGTIAKKDYNIYYTSTEVADFYLEKIFNENKNIDYINTGIAPYNYAAPFILVTNAIGRNDPFALGGTQNSKRTMRLYAISDKNYNQEALNGLLLDSANKMIPMVNDSATPYTANNDLKSGTYNYCSVRNSFGCAGGAYIKAVYSYRVDQKSNKTNTMLISFYDFELEKIRDPS